MPKPFYLCLKLSAYFPFLGCAWGRVGSGALEAGAVGFEAASIFFCVSVAGPALLFEALLLADMLIARDNTIKDIASIHVPFSKKSPVFCTPINCDELEKLDVKPPPLGFWINTMAPNSTHTIIARMMNIKYISLC